MEYKLTKREIDLISEALKNHINYYKGWLLIKKEGTEKAEEQIAFIKAKIRELEELQEKTTYLGQEDKFK